MRVRSERGEVHKMAALVDRQSPDIAREKSTTGSTQISDARTSWGC
jgi:hypothetical protein